MLFQFTHIGSISWMRLCDNLSCENSTALHQITLKLVKKTTRYVEC